MSESNFVAVFGINYETLQQKILTEEITSLPDNLVGVFLYIATRRTQKSTKEELSDNIATYLVLLCMPPCLKYIQNHHEYAKVVFETMYALKQSYNIEPTKEVIFPSAPPFTIHTEMPEFDRKFLYPLEI